MKIAVDSSVLLDVLGADPTFGAKSRQALRIAYDSGALVACDVVWAEVRAFFDDDRAFDDAMNSIGIVFQPMSPGAARLAGALWRKQRGRNSKPRARPRVSADFLIGAHAQVDAEGLLTRDRGFFRDYFKQLHIRGVE